MKFKLYNFCIKTGKKYIPGKTIASPLFIKKIKSNNTTSVFNI